jgi:hypothetical protein
MELRSEAIDALALRENRSPQFSLLPAEDLAQDDCAPNLL